MTDVLESTFGKQLLNLQVMHKTETTAYRLMCQRELNEARAKHTRFEMLKSRPLIMVQDGMTRKFQIDKWFNTYILERENGKFINKTT